MGALVLELPPRARRIHAAAQKQQNEAGTTSACAENTPLAAIMAEAHRNYLRVRGEYRFCIQHLLGNRELPPRARRIRGGTIFYPRYWGTTSACAENTHVWTLTPWFQRNYLRVRGEYGFAVGNRVGFLELPPRARRIPPVIPAAVAAHGTTSACAENTRINFDRLTTIGNYLRVRGEYIRSRPPSLDRLELPPRARRIR